jgi:5-methylthioadenosine/S-adenosylhomocysteine deaminase
MKPLRFHWLICVALVAAPAAQTRRSVTTILTGGTVVTADASKHIYNPGAVAIDGPTIIAVGSAGDIAARFTASQQISTARSIVMPGLVNTHGHAPMVLYRGLADDLRLQEWLEKYIFPAEAKTVSREMVRAGTRLAALEMIQSGTTTFADMYYFEEEIARVTKAAGMRGVLGQTIIQFPVADAKTPQEALVRNEAFIKEFVRDELIVPAVAPHSPYTLAAQDLLASRALATKYGVPVLIHVAESEAELENSKKAHSGMSPVAYLQAIGFWGPRTVAKHGVWVDAADIALLKSHEVAVSHNPESNMKLASGIAPVSEYVAAGVTIGLGTDGAASNNDLDMFEAMRFAALLHKVKTGDPRTLPAEAVLEMATIQGARALGLEKQIGSLEAGKRADVIVVSTASARMTPMYQPVSHLVYAAHGEDVRTVMVNGRVLMRDRRMLTLDEPAILAEAQKLANQVRAAVGKPASP